MSSHVLVMNDSFDHELAAQPLTVAPKHETIDALSCHLPTGGAHVTGEPDHSPILVHTDVLDSVFSTNLDADDPNGYMGTPMFDDLDFIMDGSKVNSKEDWVSLFKDDDVDAKFDKDESLDDLVGDDFKESFDFVPVVPKVKQLETPSTPMLQTPIMDDFTATSESMKPPTGVKRKSSVDHLGCVSYIKKQRSQPLQPIEPESGDPVAMKRARNTEAARRSRARKMERMSQLEDKVEDLMQDKAELHDEVLRLREILAAHNIMF